MGADNWGVCPQCKVKAIKAREAKQLAADEAYGKAPPEEYLAMLKAIEGQLVFPETLREDYEIHTDADGEFFVSYSCSCSECNFNHRFKHEQQLPVNGPALNKENNK